MNANGYISVLDHAVIHTLPHFNQTFQQDKAASVMAWLKDYDVDVIESPPNSPDLNIIETVWSIIKKIHQQKMSSNNVT